jgi:hypothetical protein
MDKKQNGMSIKTETMNLLALTFSTPIPMCDILRGIFWFLAFTH